jgi:type I restriction enzyme M protein
MDASQYKDYVLTLLFVKYVSDKYAGKRDAVIEVPEGGSFADMVLLKHKKDIGDGMNKIIGKLATANDLRGVIDVADFNDSDKLGRDKAMVDKLSKLIAIFENPALDFSKNRADGDDLLGDAYEYLMRHFATESGKSKGQFYTPAEVSRILANVIGIQNAKSQDQTIYDPTCGSGSLLLKAADETEHGMSIYGQENDNATAALAKMNMILHNYPTAEIKQDNTLANPLFLNGDGSLKTFDYVVANPPFSYKSWSNGLHPQNDVYGRFSGFGIPPEKNGDYAFLLHIIRSLKSTGKGAVILPHGVLFRGGSEAEIRTNLMKRGYIKGIIGLPANLFYGTGIPACIIVIDKENAAARKGIFMIDASKGFEKEGNKNRLKDKDIHKIVDTFNNQLEQAKYSRMVPLAEIETNEFNLNIPRYIDSQEPEDIQDIAAHLLGGIPETDINALQQYWEVYPNMRAVLFTNNKRKGYLDLLIPKEEIKQTIYQHSEFTVYQSEIKKVFNKWKAAVKPELEAINIGDKPKVIIRDISENLLKRFAGLRLIDKYDIYQHLMTYWTDTMQDDVYTLVADGWNAGRIVESQEKKKEWDGLLIPKSKMINEYFREEQEEIDSLTANRDELTQQLTELEEEHGGDEGFFSQLDKVNKANVAKRLKEIKKDKSAKDEMKVLETYLDINDRTTELNGKLKVTVQALDEALLEKYWALTETEIKELVIDRKWTNTIEQAVTSELESISQRLTQRIKELAERYETPLPKQNTEVAALEEVVNAHLQSMGFVWS